RHDVSLITSTAQIGLHLFVQSVFKGPFDRLQGTGVDLVIDLVLDIARQGAPAHNLHIVGKAASGMKLRCMAHRDIVRGNTGWLSCFYRMSRVDSISRNHPYTIVIRVVLDNLNTHKIASLYTAFEPAEARRIARTLELHYTPKHGSWLNMAEIE